MPTPPKTFVALANNYEQVDRWMRQWKVNPKSVRYASSMYIVRGLSDFTVIVFSGWSENKGRGTQMVGEYLFRRQQMMYNVDYYEPIVDANGIITSWRRASADSRTSVRP